MKTFEIIRFPYHIWWKHEDFFFQDVDLGVKSFSETSGLQRWSKTCSNQLVLSIAPILDRFGQLHLKIMTILQKVSQIPLSPQKRNFHMPLFEFVYFQHQEATISCLFHFLYKSAEAAHGRRLAKLRFQKQFL